MLLQLKIIVFYLTIFEKVIYSCDDKAEFLPVNTDSVLKNHFIEFINTFIHQGYIKLIKINSKDIYTDLQKYYIKQQKL